MKRNDANRLVMNSCPDYDRQRDLNGGRLRDGLVRQNFEDTPRQINLIYNDFEDH